MDRVTGTTVTPRPVIEVDSPVALATWRSATRASCSILMRSSGSVFGSEASPTAIEQRQLAGRLPVDRALLLEELGQVAEQGHALERVVVAEGVAA